jgi:hypothetical protein
VFRTLPAPPPGAQSGESDIDEARRLQLEYSAKTLGLRSTGIVLQRNVTTQGKQRTVRYGLALRHTGVRLGGGGVPKGIDGDYGVDAIFFEIAQNGTILPSSSGELPILRATRQFGYLNWRSCLLLRDEREVAERFAGFAGREYKARWRERFLSEREAGTAVRAIEIMLRSQLGERTRVSTRTQQVDFGLANEVYADRADCARRLLNDYRPINGRIGWARRWNGSDIYGCIQVATIFVGWVVVVALVWTLMMNIWTLRERTKMRKRRLARKKWVKWKGSYEVAFQNPAYGIWLMPTLGFAGTVIGMIEAIQGAGGVLAENIVDRRVAVQSISNNLATAFDTTFVGLLCSAIAYLLYTLILRHADYHAKK